MRVCSLLLSMLGSISATCLAVNRCKQARLEAQAPNVSRFTGAGKQAWKQKHRMTRCSQVQASTLASASTECLAIYKRRQAHLEAQATNASQFTGAGKHARKRRQQLRRNLQVQASALGSAGNECVAIYRCRQARPEAQATNAPQFTGAGNHARDGKQVQATIVSQFTGAGKPPRLGL